MVAGLLLRTITVRLTALQDLKRVAVEGAEGEGDVGGGLGKAVAEARRVARSLLLWRVATTVTPALAAARASWWGISPVR